MSEEELDTQLQRQARRIQKAERERPTLMAQTVFVGSLGLMMVIPVVVGAYLGHWLDGLVVGYSVRWTISLIVLGVVLGAVNVYLYIKE